MDNIAHQAMMRLKTAKSEKEVMDIIKRAIQEAQKKAASEETAKAVRATYQSQLAS